MRRFVSAFLIALVAAPLAASAKSPRDNFEKIVSKVAPSDAAKSKTVCICFASGSERRAGLLEQRRAGNNVYVDCKVTHYAANGDVIGAFSCSDFEVAR